MAVDEQIQDSPDVGTPAPPQTDPVEKYYNYLKQAGADVAPSLDSFRKTLNNDKTAQQYYNYLRANKFDAPPNYGSFAKTLGIAQTTPSYQTTLSPDEEQKYQQWKSKLPGDLQNDNDYDLRGQYKENPNVQPSDRLHFTDEFKKPNHITFSDESKYNDPSKGVIGGHWDGDDNSGTFYASAQNVKNAGGLDKLQQYFKQQEPGYKVVPPGPDGKPAIPPPPEHQISHDPIQDIRHIQEMAGKPAPQGYSTATGGMGGGGGYVAPDPTELAQYKGYQDQYTKMATDLGATWGAKPETIKQVLTDFPDEQNPDKLKSNAALAESNPAAYYRLKNADAIRMQIAKDGPNGVHDANEFNAAQNAHNYQQLTELNIPYQQQLIQQHNLGPQAMDQLKETQRPLINSLDPGLNQKYWESGDKELGLSLDEYAGLETERLFNPNKAAMDLQILRHAQGIGEDGKAHPVDMTTQPYTYQRGVENVKYNLSQTGRQNLSMYISEKRPELDQQINGLVQSYKDKMATATPSEQQQLQQQFNQEPAVLQANDLENGQQQLQYSESEDSRLYPLNFNDQATRIVRDAMQQSGFQGSDIPNVAGKVASGVFKTYQGTADFVKNLAINIAGSDASKAFNNATSSGEKSITDLTGYLGAQSSGAEQPLNVPRGIVDAIQGIQNDPELSDLDKQRMSVNYLKDNWDKLTVNPKVGQQNLTGKSLIYGAADMTGQIMGIASQSFLLGGVIGDASKLQKLASAFTPMYMSTQDQLYQQAVKDGKEHPLLESNMDAAIISLASLINPDLKVVKTAAGIDTPIGKMIAGVSEDTWNKVLSENKPIVDQMTGAIKGTARQMGLAQLQYGLIAPTAQYLVHKNILGEDANLGDMIKDGVIQTSIQMAAPSLLHGLWGGIKATDVNPMQKYALVEAGLHPDQNIDLVDSQIKAGQISEVKGHEIKMLIKHAGEFMLDPNLKMTDGTPMNEQQVSDNLYNSIKKKSLETSLKTAPEPLKPVIQEKLHEVNKEIADGFTSEKDKQTAELNQLLHDNLDRIKDKAPEMEQPVKDAIKQNTPEDIFKTISDKAKETKNVEGKEVSNQDEVEKVYGKPLVEKAIELSKQKPKANEKTTDNAKAEGQVAQPEGAETTLAGQEAAPSIHPTADFRTWNLGDMEGKPENEAAKKHLEGVVRAWDQHPAGETGGEPFGEFVNRVIPAFDKILKEEPNNTTIVTHSSVLKAMRVWDEMGRPEVDKMTPEQKKVFAGKYNATETQNGDLETFKGPNGDIKVIRHGQTEDNEKNNFRSGDTPLTQKGIDQAGEVGQQLKDETGGNVPKIITSDLPRTIHSSNIINDKLQENTEGSAQNAPIPEQGAANVEPEQPTGNGPVANNPEGAEQNVGGGQTGIAERVKKGREADAGVKAPEPGEGASTQAMVDRGRELLSEGADPEKVMDEFYSDKKISADGVALVRAKLEQLAKATDAAIDEHGENSKEADAARQAESAWADRIQPMQTEWSKIGMAQQGSTDIDTGTVSSIKRAFRDVSGKPLTERQSGIAKDLHERIKTQDAKIADLQNKLDETIKNPQSGKGIKEKAKDLANKIRENAKLSRPGMFSAASPASLVWDGAVETVAKAVEAGGALADAIGKGIDHIKASDWYKGLSKAKQADAVKQFEDWHKDQSTEKIDIATHFVDKKDNNFSTNESKAIWEHTKEVMQNKTDFHDVIHQVATDTGLSPEQVRRAISQPKGAKTVTDQMYATMYRRNQVLQSAKVWVKSADQPYLKKLWNSVIKIPSAIVTFGHGSVAPITHVGADLYRPTNWKSYFNFMLNSYKFSFGGMTEAGKARYEQAMGDMVRDPMYPMAKRSGLKIDPTDLSGDDYSKDQGVFGRLSKMGERGFNAMKPYRLEQFKKIYNGISDQAKANPEVIKTISHMVNLSTGTTDAKIPTGTDAVFFAPKLVTSQYQRIFTEPAKAATTFINWDKATDSQKLQAKMVAGHAGQMVATYLSLLAANSAILAMTGSKQKINLTNPLNSDWMKFKVGDKTIDASGGMNSALRFVGSLLEEGARANGIVKTPEKSKPGDSEGSKILQQLSNKLSPFASDIKEGFSGTDAVGNPLPWSTVKAGTGKHQLSWSEYLSTKLPIPIAEGIKTFNESAQNAGMPKSNLDSFLQGLLVGGLTGTTGAKVAPDYSLDKKPAGRMPRGSK